jgi:ribosomal protein L14E/L6E/L27E
MAAIENGRECVVTAGRRTGAKVTISKIVGEFAVVKDEKGKERKFLIKHLEPSGKK